MAGHYPPGVFDCHEEIKPFPPDYKVHFLAGFCSEESGDCILYSPLRCASVQSVAAENTIEELNQIDLGDLRECIEQSLVFSDQSRPMRLWWYDSLEWCEWYDVEILQAWVTLNASEA